VRDGERDAAASGSDGTAASADTGTEFAAAGVDGQTAADARRGFPGVFGL
jgi:hypothetical protein